MAEDEDLRGEDLSDGEDVDGPFLAHAVKMEERASYASRQKGVRPGPGRGKGVPNKITVEAKIAIALAFEGMGGVDALTAWGKKHQTAFYCQVFPKLLPLNVHGRVDVTHHDGDRQLLASKLERILVGLIDARRDGRDDPGVVIDGERAREPGPQLVLPRPTGAEAAGDAAGFPRPVAELVVPGGSGSGQDEEWSRVDPGVRQRRR